MWHHFSPADPTQEHLQNMHESPRPSNNSSPKWPCEYLEKDVPESLRAMTGRDTKHCAAATTHTPQTRCKLELLLGIYILETSASLLVTSLASSNRCLTSSNRCLTSSNKKLSAYFRGLLPPQIWRWNG